MKQSTIVIAGTTMTVTELPTRRNRAWQKMLTARLQPAADLLKNKRTIKLPSSLDELQSDEKEFDIGPLLDVGNDLAGLFFNGLDDVADLVIEYVPELKAEKEQVLDVAYDSEFVFAFWEVLKLAFPFGEMKELLGQVQGMISQNSGSVSTDDGMMA